MINTRNTAFKILLAVEQDGAYSALALNNSIKENNLNRLDSAFVSALVYGVLERRILLDYIIRQYSKIPLKKIDLKTKLVLRLGILQLLFMDKVPESAAVNESVKLAKKQKLFKSSGFINGVLRSMTRAEEKYKLPDKKDLSLYLSVKYSCPEDVIKMWLSSYGEEITTGILESSVGRPSLNARVNTLICNTDSLIAELEKEGIKAEKSSLVEDSVQLFNTGSVEGLRAYSDGKLYIQDNASQLCVKALDPKPGQIMLDVCSAPGGKAFTAAQRMNNHGRIYAFDIYEHKLRIINETAKRLKTEIIKTEVRDAEKAGGELPNADRILCDVPCSGLGIIGRKPEIKYKDNLLCDNLPELQYRILCNNAGYLKSGGVLVYSTCTLNPAENNRNAEKFLKEHPDFEPLPLNLGVNRLIDEPPHMLTLFPQANESDGFFIAAFTRK